MQIWLPEESRTPIRIDFQVYDSSLGFCCCSRSLTGSIVGGKMSVLFLSLTQRILWGDVGSARSHQSYYRGAQGIIMMSVVSGEHSAISQDNLLFLMRCVVAMRPSRSRLDRAHADEHRAASVNFPLASGSQRCNNTHPGASAPTPVLQLTFRWLPG